MKRILVVIIAFVGLTAALSSCKSHETCPAYGQLEQEQTEQNS